MKTLLLGLVVLAAAPRIARADGWWVACDENHDGQTDCNCSTSTSDPVAVGASLGVVGIVAWRIGKKRRNR